MHDPRVLLEMGDDAVRRLARRGYTLDLARLEELFSRRTSGITKADKLRAESNRVTQEVQQVARGGGDVSELKDHARALKDEIRQTDAEREQAGAELRELLLGIPNLPLDFVPDGDGDDDAVEIRRHGEPPVFGFEPKDHVDLGEAMGIFDFARAS
jgi:seryl-tRNA synthetase